MHACSLTRFQQLLHDLWGGSTDLEPAVPLAASRSVYDACWLAYIGHCICSHVAHCKCTHLPFPCVLLCYTYPIMYVACRSPRSQSTGAISTSNTQNFLGPVFKKAPSNLSLTSFMLPSPPSGLDSVGTVSRSSSSADHRLSNDGGPVQLVSGPQSEEDLRQEVVALSFAVFQLRCAINRLGARYRQLDRQAKVTEEQNEALTSEVKGYVCFAKSKPNAIKLMIVHVCGGWWGVMHVFSWTICDEQSMPYSPHSTRRGLTRRWKLGVRMSSSVVSPSCSTMRLMSPRTLIMVAGMLCSACSCSG